MGGSAREGGVVGILEKFGKHHFDVIQTLCKFGFLENLVFLNEIWKIYGFEFVFLFPCFLGNFFHKNEPCFPKLNTP